MNSRTNEIINAVAKMNDSFLPLSDEGQRQYTMCHEIGHGLGLPHWDEDFRNEDMGNCMDYTNRPENNMEPDENLFSYLWQLYGSFSRREEEVEANIFLEDEGRKSNDVGGRRLGRAPMQQQALKVDLETVHPQDGTTRLLVANDRVQVYHRTLEDGEHVHAFVYFLA